MKKKSICSSLGRFRACKLFEFFKHDWNMFSKSQYKGEASKDYQQFGNTLRKNQNTLNFVFKSTHFEMSIIIFNVHYFRVCQHTLKNTCMCMV